MKIQTGETQLVVSPLGFANSPFRALLDDGGVLPVATGDQRLCLWSPQAF
ncbi:MAG: hypothetical protein IJX94_03940 [Clostridia bacterium]|nr:hypothetical protein [Clostridia bacterium]